MFDASFTQPPPQTGTGFAPSIGLYATLPQMVDGESYSGAVIAVLRHGATGAVTISKDSLPDGLSLGSTTDNGDGTYTALVSGTPTDEGLTRFAATNGTLNAVPLVIYFVFDTTGSGGGGGTGHDLIAVSQVTHYTDLPGGLDTDDAGKGYEVLDDGLLYVWDGTEFPVQGSGLAFRGPAGSAGADGTAGADGADGSTGMNAVTQTIGSTTQPAVNSTVSFHVFNALWMTAGQGIFVNGGGYYSVSSVTDSTHAVLQNLGYPGNASPGATIAGSSLMTPGGLPGARGTIWNTGTGAPGTITGQAANDYYLDTTASDVYSFNGTSWNLVGNIKGAAGGTALVYSDSTLVDVVNTVTKSNICSFTVPANTLGANGLMEVIVDVDCLINPGTGTPTETLEIGYGGTAMWADTTAALTAAAGRHPGVMRLLLRAMGATNSQRLFALPALGRNAGANTGLGDLANAITAGLGFNTPIQGVASVDSTADQTFYIAVTHSAADANISFRKQDVLAYMVGSTKGDKGDAGATGINAATTTAGSTTVPAVNSTVSFHVFGTGWMSAGQTLYVATGGYYQVSSITDGTHVVLTNLGITGNASPGATISASSLISPAGAQGAAGTNGSAGAGLNPTVTTLTISSGVVNIDCSLGQYFKLTLNANVTSVTFSNVPATGNGVEVCLDIAQDGTGSRTFALPASLKAIGNSDTAIQSAASAKTRIIASSIDGGTTWEYVMGAVAA